MIAISPLPWLLLLDGRLGRFDATILLAGLAGYTFLTIRDARSKGDPALATEFSTDIKEPASRWWLAAMVVAVRQALDVIIASYEGMGLTDLAEQSRAVYVLNFPDGQLKREPKRWYQFW